MKIITSIRLRIWFGCFLATGLMLWLSLAVLSSVEPAWQGHRLSEWLSAFDSNWRFDEGDGRHSRFSDAEIEQALEGIGPAALPFLREWLTMKPSRLKVGVNRLLNRQSWIPFRFRDDRDGQDLAVTGFMAYGTDAQPLLPELLRLSQSRDAETRELAYEAAFFTWPSREIFLPLATRALSEQVGHIRAMAAQRMVERFPEDAERAGLRDWFPSQFAEQHATDFSSSEE